MSDKVRSAVSPGVKGGTRFRLAIIGCGKVAASHVEAALSSDLAEVAALVDATPGRAQALAERFDINPRLAEDISQVAGEVDGAVIATPNATHAPIAEQCLLSGVAVLIEKPLGVSPDDGRRIGDAAAQTGCTVAVGYVSRFRGNVRQLGTLIRDRYFGRIHRFAYQFGTKGGWAPLSGYNLDRRTSGGGVLVNTGTHFIDRMLDWFGYPDEMFLVDDSEGGPEANATAYFTFGGDHGFRGIARFSKTVALPAGFVMETDQGTVMLKDRSDAPILFYPNRSPDLVHAVSSRGPAAGAGDEFVQQLEDFIVAARTRRPPFVTVEQGRLSLRLIDELYRHRRAHAAAREPVR
jgi:predicted dehydrogenase